MAQLRGLAASAWTALRSAVGAPGRDTDNQSASLSERLPLYQQDDHEVSGGSASQSERTVRTYVQVYELRRLCSNHRAGRACQAGKSRSTLPATLDRSATGWNVPPTITAWQAHLSGLTCRLAVAGCALLSLAV